MGQENERLATKNDSTFVRFEGMFAQLEILLARTKEHYIRLETDEASKGKVCSVGRSWSRLLQREGKENCPRPKVLWSIWAVVRGQLGGSWSARWPSPSSWRRRKSPTWSFRGQLTAAGERRREARSWKADRLFWSLIFSCRLTKILANVLLRLDHLLTNGCRTVLSLSWPRLGLDLNRQFSTDVLVQRYFESFVICWGPCEQPLTSALYSIEQATSHTLKRGRPLVSRSACMTFIPDRWNIQSEHPRKICRNLFLRSLHNFVTSQIFWFCLKDAIFTKMLKKSSWINS